MNEFDLYKDYINRGCVAYDIGAHIGQIAVQMLQKEAKVYAFEPSPNNFPILKANCERLGIKCFDVALHDKNYSCLTQFKDCRTDYTDSNGKKNDTIQQIYYVILEDFIKSNDLELPDFIKLDIEGMESLVLKTFKFLFEGKRPILYVEIHAQSRNLDNQNYPDNPHWVWPEDGGFNFNNLKNYNYNIIINNKILDINQDWNPKENSHSNMILKPI
jgi:FkbM family methyltransferase